MVFGENTYFFLVIYLVGWYLFVIFPFQVPFLLMFKLQKKVKLEKFVNNCNLLITANWVHHRPCVNLPNLIFYLEVNLLSYLFLPGKNYIAREETFLNQVVESK